MPDDGQVPPRGPSGGPPPSDPPPGSGGSVHPGPPPGWHGAPVGGGPPGAGRVASPGAERLGGRQLPIRPMSVGDVLDGAFSGLRATFVPIAIIVALVLGPVQLILNLVLSRLAPELTAGGLLGTFGEFDDAVGFGDVSVAGVTLLFGAISLGVSLIASAAAVALLLQVDRGAATDVSTSLRTGVSVFWGLLAATFMVSIGGLAAVIAAILLGVLLSVTIPIVGAILTFLLVLPVVVIGGAAAVGTYGMLVPIAVIERRGPIATIGRALWVVRRRFWRLVGITLLLGLLASLATAGLQLLFVLLSVFAGPVDWIVTTIGEVLAQIVVVPITAFGALLVYLDARVRHEGLDLELRARGVGGP